MNRYLKSEELPQWDAIAVTLHIEGNSTTTYYINRQDLKPGVDLIAKADSDNNGWSSWGSLIVEEILPDGVMTSLGELTPEKNLHEDYPNVYPYHDGDLTAKLVNMHYKVTAEDPESGKSYTALIPRQRYLRDSNFLEPLITMAREYFPEAKGYIKYLESLRPTPITDPIKWRVSVYKDKTCGIWVESGLYPKTFDFPGTVKHDGATYKVVNIHGGGSFRCGELQQLIFADGIKSIDGFNGFKHLTAVTLPPSLVELGYEAFCRCERLSEIQFPESVTYIGASAFYGTNISKVQLPKNLEAIRNSAFGHTPIRCIAIPEKVDTISSGCFMDCSELVEVKLPEGLRVIDKMAFKNCTKLACINIPDGLRYIGEEAFAGCSSLTEISLPKHVLLHPDAFKDCQCEISYRDCAEIPSWKKVNVVQRQWITKKDKSDFKYTKSYKQISDEPEYNEVCDGSCGFYSVTINGFNEKFVRVVINGDAFVLMAGESKQFNTNMSKEEIIKVI